MREKPTINKHAAAKLIYEKIKAEFIENPPKIGLIGVSGVGKSSTINSMFKTKLEVSNTVACTKEFENVDLELQYKDKLNNREIVSLRIVDAPGLGEDHDKDDVYLEYYLKELPLCDVILWITSARNRAVALEQVYLKKLIKFQEKIVFGINQIDIVEPIDWKENFNVPSSQQNKNIKIITKDRRDKFKKTLKHNPRIIAYSAKFGYNLESLFKMLVQSFPEKRRWMLAGVKNFSYKDFLPIKRKTTFLETFLKGRQNGLHR